MSKIKLYWKMYLLLREENVSYKFYIRMFRLILQP